MSTPSARAYRVLLRMTPRRLRTKHAREMEELFLDTLAGARAAGRPAVISVWAHALADVIVLALRSARGRRARIVEVRPAKGTLMVDWRYALRSLGRQKLSTTLVIGMLALGIAASIVVFSLINGLFLRPFPFPESERLVYVNEKAPRWNLDDHVGINYPDFHQWRQGAEAFEALGLLDTDSFNLATPNGAERLDGARVTYDFGEALRIRPVLGRMFTPDEDRPNGPPVVLIGRGLWEERFGRDPDVLGRTLRLNGAAHTIVGVLPPEAEFPGGVRLWVPLQGDPSQEGQSYSYSGIGRLKPGVTVSDAERDLLRAHQPVWEARDRERIVSPYVIPLRQEYADSLRTMSSMLAAAVALLLVIACANVASIILARALARQREMGIRLAMGASRLRLLGQLFVENLALAAGGGALGLAGGYWALGALLAAFGDQVPRWASFDPDWRVWAFSFAATGATAVLFGWAPALHTIRRDPRAALHDVRSGSTTQPGARRTLVLLVGAEFAMAAVLVVCGTLLLRAYQRVGDVDPGFRPEGVLTFSLALPQAAYPDEGARLAFWDRLVVQLRALPGVDAAGLVNCVPFSCHWGKFFVAEGQPPRLADESNPVVLFRPATPGYFAAMGVRLESGRFFEERDGRDPDHGVVIVNETFARTFFPGVEHPVGQRIREADEGAPWWTIVGVVQDVKHYGLERPMRPGLYLPLPRIPIGTLAVALRTSIEPTALTETAWRTVAALDPELPLFRVQTMEGALTRSLAERRLYSVLLLVFATMALVLALGGVYGVTSYLVTQRTREIGIRMALGARQANIVRAVLRTSLTPVGIGLVTGLATAMALAGLMQDLLFGVPAYDATVLSTAVVLLGTAALLGNWLPTWRAARVDPTRTLHTE